MKGYQKSSPNLKFLQPQLTARQPKRTDSNNLRFDVQKTYRTNQTENSMSIDKIYQITPSRVLTLKNMSRVMKSNFIHKTEPNETFDKQNIDNQRMLSRKQTAPKLIYRPIIKQNSEVFCMKDSPRIIQNTSMLESNSIYYISDVVSAFESKENYFNRLFKEHFSSSCMALKQCANSKIIYKPKPVIIQNNPQNIKKYILLFDLDETLVHCTLDLKLPCDKKLIIKLSQDETFQVGVSVRPGLQLMLELLEPNFEIIVFTASHGQYAKRIVEYIDPKKIISRVLSREHCCFTDQGQYVKDLSIIKNLPISRTLLVDNCAISYLCQLDNGVPIIPYYDNKQDKQLLQLAKYLNGMVGADDLREQNQYHFIPIKNKFKKLSICLAINSGIGSRNVQGTSLFEKKLIGQRQFQINFCSYLLLVNLQFNLLNKINCSIINSVLVQIILYNKLLFYQQKNNLWKMQY